MAEAIKTLKIKIVNPNKGKKDAFEETTSYLNRVLETYLSLTLQHQELFQREKESVNKQTGEVRLRPLSNSEILTELEKLSLPTQAHPETEVNLKSLFPSLPTLWRRSCINTSTGMVKSYLTNLNNWMSQRAMRSTTPSTQKGNPPKPPGARNLPTFYKGTYQLQIQSLADEGVTLHSTSNPQIEKRAVAVEGVVDQVAGDIEGVVERCRRRRTQQITKPRLEMLDIHNQFVRLKVFNGQSWVWKNYPVKMGSKQLKQLNDPKWSMQSPTLVPKQTKRGTQWYLHIPVVKKIQVKPIKEQQKENPSLTTLAVDLGLRHLAVVTVRTGGFVTADNHQNGRIVFVKFFRGKQVEAHRLQHLQKVFRKQRLSGKPVRGERSNKKLWRHIRDTNTDIAHQMTSEIVELAKKFSVQVIVVEHLHQFLSRKGEKRSKKLNRKLTYWLKGQIEDQLRYKAFSEGILVKSVSPAFTSQICNRCGGFGERFSHKSLFRCHFCGYEANADFNASVNLHRVFWDIFPRPQKRKLVLKKPPRKGKVAHSGVS